MLQVLGAAAEFERSLIVERSRPGRVAIAGILRPARWARPSTAGQARTCRRTGPGGFLIAKGWWSSGVGECRSGGSRA
jgi:hypothetical protein